MSDDKQIDSKFVVDGANRVSDEDVRRVTEQADRIEDKAARAGALKQFLGDIKLFIELVRAYASGGYREIPWWAISAVVFALLYVLSPVDAIPDVIPVLGFVDDAAVVAACLTMVREELMRFEAWKNSAKGEPAEPGLAG